MTPQPERLTLSPVEAAARLGRSRDWFDEHVKPEIKTIRRGQVILVPVAELERWGRDNANHWREAS